MENLTTKINANVRALLQNYYHEGNIKAATRLRTALYDVYDSDAVDKLVVSIYDQCDSHVLYPDDHDSATLGTNINFIKIMCSIIQDITEYSDDDDWALDLIKRALHFVPTREYALQYLESDIEIGMRFTDILRELIDEIEADKDTPKDTQCYIHVRQTLALFNDVYEARNHIFEVDPKIIAEIKEVLFNEETEVQVFEIWDQLHYKYNGATANHVIVEIMDGYIATANYDGLYNILLQGFDEIEYFNDEIVDAPIRALKYVMTLPATQETAELFNICFTAIRDLLGSMDEYGDETDVTYVAKLETNLSEMKSDIFKHITDENDYHDLMDLVNETKCYLANEDDDEDEDLY